jgi:hypothetical protein
MSEKVHYVSASLTCLSLAKAGKSALEITVLRDNSKSDDDDDPARERVGDLKIGYGGLYWKSGKKRTTSTKVISWSAFDKYMSTQRKIGNNLL